MIVLDANILLETLERRQSYDEVVRALERYAADETVDFCISALTVSNVFYLSEKHKIPAGRVETLLKEYKVFGVLAEDVQWALAHYGGRDFEDAVQVAAALREKCRAFLTLDALLAKKYSKFLNVELIR